MGQGFSLATPSAGSAGIDIPQLQDVQYERSLGNARFLKSIRGRHENGLVLVKVLLKPYGEVNLDKYRQRLLAERKALADVPNALPFQRIIETETNGYLVRQFHYSSLYDRISTRPFLEDVEKKWLAFQLLCALRDCHARDVYHGDIKSQNVLVTSWNWLFLTDFSAAYKPVLLPEDNPGDFSYFFDSSGHRTCYIAPERFQASGEASPQNAKMTAAMDVFSAGCVIAQMFLESEIFSLAQLYKYKRGEFDPVITHLGVISDKDVRDLIAHMIQIDPNKRYSAEQYLKSWKGKVFPHYFYNFLHQYMALVTDPSSGNTPMSGTHRNMGESDDRIDRVFYDFDKISYFLGYQSEKRTPDTPGPMSKSGLGLLPVQLSIPNHHHAVSSDLDPPEDDGTLIFLTLVVSSMRTTARASSRVRACDILLAFAERLTDEAKLDRVLPYLMTLLKKEEPDIVIVTAIRTITQLLELVRTPTPINSHLMVEYVLPRLGIALGSRSRISSSVARATYASCLGSLASTAQRFFDIASSFRADGTMPIADPEVEPNAKAEANFDNAGRDLFEILENHTKQLVEDADVHVRRAFLASVPQLCMFFQERSNDVLLTHLNTYLNDPDWELKCAFFDAIVGIAAFVGSTTLELFMLPLMVQALVDHEEFVVQSALHSLAQLAGLGLLSTARIWELVDLIAPFTMHPNIWIREAAAEFLSESSLCLHIADVKCILLPLIGPFLMVSDMVELDELAFLDLLKKPLGRVVFDQATAWASQTDKGAFWKSLQKMRSLALGSSSNRVSKDSNATGMSKATRNDEDEQWLSKLRNHGLGPDDEMKLWALREFIYRLTQSTTRSPQASEPDVQTGLVSLKELGVTPQTVFFNDAPLRDPSLAPNLDSPAGSYTIADALLDASMTIDDAINRRRKAAPNVQTNRGQSAGPLSSAPRRLLSPEGSTRASSRHAREGSFDSREAAAGEGDVDISISGRPYSARRTVRHKASALSLLDRKDGSKSTAETSTNGTNAFGEVEGPFVLGTATTSSPTSRGEARQLGSGPARHTYEGTDPHIQLMLDKMYVGNFPRDVVEFGPMVQPIARSKARAAPPLPRDELWRPKGHLLAVFCEHKGPINRIAASPDHVFFITGGNDGCVRVWDSARLERTMTNRSRQTHKHAEGARVMAVCFVENSHCFVSCASDGSVHIVKVDTVTASGAVRYGKLRIVREYQLPEGEHAVWCEHLRQESNSVLLLATNRSRILGIELRTMATLYSLENPLNHGAVTCFCVDRKRNWLCVGTSHGILDLWDLRFNLRLRGWGATGKGPIYRMYIHPTKGRGKWVCISGGTGQGEVTVWDLEKTTCREIYRTSASKDGPGVYEAWDVDQEGMLQRFATNLENSDASNADRGVRAMLVATGAVEDSRDVRYAFIVTGGSDRKLRFWDISRIENSRVYSGLSSDEQQPTFTATVPTTGVTLNVEKLHKPPTSSSPAAAPMGESAAGGRSRGKKSGGRPPRSTVISLQQQQLLQSHYDAVTDVILLEHPFTMSVSVDRSGVVYCFQ